MPDIQKVEALIRIIDNLLTAVESSVKRHGSFDERDKLQAAREELERIKKDK